MQLRVNGHDIYGFGERKTPAPFVNACTTFLYLDSPGDSEVASPTTPATPPARAKPANASKAPRAPEAEAKRPLAQDTTLVTALRGRVEAAARADGWALLSTAGGAVKRQAPIDPRNYGVRNFPALFEATGLFEIVRGDNGQQYVADKRNGDRAQRPGG